MPWVKGLANAEKLEALMHDVLERYHVKCICDKRLSSKGIRTVVSQPTEDSIPEYWVYIECANCHYDYNHEKVARQVTAIIRKNIDDFNREFEEVGV